MSESNLLAMAYYPYKRNVKSKLDEDLFSLYDSSSVDNIKEMMSIDIMNNALVARLKSLEQKERAAEEHLLTNRFGITQLQTLNTQEYVKQFNLLLNQEYYGMSILEFAEFDFKRRNKIGNATERKNVQRSYTTFHDNLPELVFSIAQKSYNSCIKKVIENWENSYETNDVLYDEITKEILPIILDILDKGLIKESDSLDEKDQERIYSIMTKKLPNQLDKFFKAAGEAIYNKMVKTIKKTLEEEKVKLEGIEDRTSQEETDFIIIKTLLEWRDLSDLIEAYGYSKITLTDRLKRMFIENLIKNSKIFFNNPSSYSLNKKDLKLSSKVDLLKSKSSTMHGNAAEVYILAEVEQRLKKIISSAEKQVNDIKNSTLKIYPLLTATWNQMKADNIIIVGNQNGSKIVAQKLISLFEGQIDAIDEGSQSTEKQFLKRMANSDKMEALGKSEEIQNLKNEVDIVFISDKTYQFETYEKSFGTGAHTGAKLEGTTLDKFMKLVKRSSIEFSEMVDKIGFVLSNTGTNKSDGIGDQRTSLISTEIPNKMVTSLAVFFGNFMFDDLVVDMAFTSPKLHRVHIFSISGIMLPFSVIIRALIKAIVTDRPDTIVDIEISTGKTNSMDTEINLDITDVKPDTTCEENLYKNFAIERSKKIKITYRVMKEFFSFLRKLTQNL